ncbi:hypothetical protein ACRRTK_016756 [Alexandromys fortis]
MLKLPKVVIIWDKVPQGGNSLEATGRKNLKIPAEYFQKRGATRRAYSRAVQQARRRWLATKLMGQQPRRAEPQEGKASREQLGTCFPAHGNYSGPGEGKCACLPDRAYSFAMGCWPKNGLLDMNKGLSLQHIGRPHSGIAFTADIMQIASIWQDLCVLAAPTQKSNGLGVGGNVGARRLEPQDLVLHTQESQDWLGPLPFQPTAKQIPAAFILLTPLASPALEVSSLQPVTSSLQPLFYQESTPEHQKEADDCKNIANIMKTLAYRGFIFKQTSKPF